MAEPALDSYTPRPLQKQIAEDPARFKVAVIHRRYGKTVMAVNDLIDFARENPGSQCFYISPFKSQSKAVAWRYLRMYAAPHGGKTRRGEELAVFFPNESMVQLLGASEGWYDIHRGKEAHRLVLDEVSQMNPEVWRSIFRPMLANTKGHALFIGTPQGRDYFHKLYTQGLPSSGMPTWRSFKRTVYETGVIDDEEIEQLRAEMDRDEFEREFLCDFDAPPKGAYFSGVLDRIGQHMEPSDPDRLVHTSWHFGDNDAATVLHWQVPKRGPRRCIRAKTYLTTSVEEIAKELHSLPYDYGRHYGPPRLHDVPHSRVYLLRKNGFRLRETESKLSLMDRIYACKNAMQSELLSFHDEDAEDLMIATRMVHAEYDEKARILTDRPERDWTLEYTNALANFVVGYRDKKTDWGKRFALVTDENYAA